MSTAFRYCVYLLDDLVVLGLFAIVGSLGAAILAVVTQHRTDADHFGIELLLIVAAFYLVAAVTVLSIALGVFVWLDVANLTAYERDLAFRFASIGLLPALFCSAGAMLAIVRSI